jgi:cytochrome d ubiquinol oxidase subunit I
MDSALFVHRLHFAFTITFHYLFPQLTMGLSLLIVILKTAAWRTGDQHYNDAARFWTRIFGINFAMGVVTGIPMEFQFGTNWALFSRAAGGVIGQTLAMEGVFSFFLESTFLGLLLYGEKRLSRGMHWFAAVCVFAGSWLSGYFIIVTDAWMQHPVGYAVVVDGPSSAHGRFHLGSLTQLLLNPWAMWQYAHNMTASVVTASFVMAAIGSFYLLMGHHQRFGETFVRTGVICGFIASVVMIFPTGDGQGKMVARYQPATLSAMEGLFDTAHGAPLALIGQPDMDKMRLDNPVVVPNMLSFLTYQRWHAKVKGLREYPREQWPENIPLLYFSYHIMVGLGTVFVAAMSVSALLLWRGMLFTRRYMLWLLMLMLPFPYIATTAGWMTAEVGRQPWLVYGLMRTADGASPQVSAGNGWFTLLGFMGLYMVLGILFLFLVQREIEHGPAATA